MSINLPISENAPLAATTHGFEYVNLELVKPEPEALALAPGDFAVKHRVLPLALDGETLVVAIGSPDALQAADDLGVLTGRPVHPVLADPQLIKDKIDEFFLQKLLQGLAGDDDTTTIEEVSDLTDLTRMADDSQVVGMVNAIFAQAVRDRASDIHIEPYEREVKVRYRIDGMLHEMMRPPKRLHNAIVSRLKILGEMNIAERRLPQDGRIKLNLGGRSIDVRVSIVPTTFGERAVMRILDKTTAMLSLEELGLSSDVLERYRKLITIPYGIILATGPTGAGKSTTLYASLQEIYSPSTNILTIEDPVEYQVPGISQIQVRSNIGLTFANGLRSFLRQDPDVIMVGEIRDHETGEIAIHAALTGHVVFSTLHTNDSAGAVTRLVDMGLEPFLVASSLSGVVAQRLVRRVCSNCAEPYEYEPEALRAIGIDPDQKGNFLKGRGCEKCTNTGYKGRVGLYELFLVDETIRRMTVDRAPSSALKEHAVQNQGMRTLIGDGRNAVLAGKTTPAEVMRVSQREDI